MYNDRPAERTPTRASGASIITTIIPAMPNCSYFGQMRVGPTPEWCDGAASVDTHARKTCKNNAGFTGSRACDWQGNSVPVPSPPTHHFIIRCITSTAPRTDTRATIAHARAGKRRSTSACEQRPSYGHPTHPCWVPPVHQPEHHPALVHNNIPEGGIRQRCETHSDNGQSTHQPRGRNCLQRTHPSPSSCLCNPP